MRKRVRARSSEKCQIREECSTWPSAWPGVTLRPFRVLRRRAGASPPTAAVLFSATGAKGPRRNNLNISHPWLTPSSTAPRSRIPRRIGQYASGFARSSRPNPTQPRAPNVQLISARTLSGSFAIFRRAWDRQGRRGQGVTTTRYRGKYRAAPARQARAVDTAPSPGGPPVPLRSPAG